MARLLLALMMFPLVALADEAVEPQSATPLLLKVLAYDVNFDARGTGDFLVLVVSEAKSTSARKTLVETLKDLPGQKLKTRAVKFVGADFKDEPSLQAEIDRAHPAALLIAPGTPEALVKAVSEVAQDNQLYALTFDAAAAEQEIPVGVELTQGKPRIVINEKAAKGVGARFESSVLKLARVIGGR